MRRTIDGLRTWLLAHPNDRWPAMDADNCPLAAECRETLGVYGVVVLPEFTQYFDAYGMPHTDRHEPWEFNFIAVVDSRGGFIRQGLALLLLAEVEAAEAAR